MKSQTNQVLSRVERDVLRWRVRYLMSVEKSLEDDIKKNQYNTHLAPVLEACRRAIFEGIKKLLDDFDNNPDRAATGYVISHWEHLRQQYDTKLDIADKKKHLHEEAFGALAKGYETTKAAMGTAKTVTEVLAKGSYIVGGAGWSSVAGESQDISKMVEKVARIFSIAVLGVFLLKDCIELIVDRFRNPHKTLKSKLLEDNRWRRMLKMTFFLSLAAVDLAYQFDPLTSGLLSGLGVLVAGIIELGRRLYEFKKIVRLHDQLASEVSNDSDDILKKRMLKASQKKLCSKRLMLVRVSVLTMFGVCGSVFLSLGTDSVPYLVVGAVLSVFVLVVELYHMRKKFKEFPAHVKQACHLAREKAKSQEKSKSGDKQRSSDSSPVEMTTLKIQAQERELVELPNCG